MLFNSNAFLLGFLPCVLGGFYLLRRSAGTSASYAFLFAASLFFYAYWDVRFLPLILGSIAVNYALAKQIAVGRRWLLTPGIFGNLGLIGYFKYAGFFVSTGNALSGADLTIPEVVLPIGISFYTFQQIAFLVDVRRGLVSRLDFMTYGLFVTFFPQLIAGPIVHHREMLRQFASGRSRAGELMVAGVVILCLGLAKKTLIADRLALVASPFFSRAVEGGDLNFFTAWMAALAYSFQIYFDFSGYSDMALGLALLFGVRLPSNFNSPYKASSIADFWGRWHMTLSRFLRDYVYIPLGGNRRGTTRRYTNLLTVMLVGGLWHGAAWTFVFWGFLHGFYLSCNYIWRGIVERARWNWPSCRFGRLLGWCLTFFAVVVAWVPFRAESWDAMLRFYSAMFLFNGFALPLEFEPILNKIGLGSLGAHVLFFAENYRSDFYVGIIWIGVAAAVAFVAPNSLQLNRRFRPTTDFSILERTWPRRQAPDRWRDWPRIVMDKMRALIDLRALEAVAVGVLFFLAFRSINSAAPTEFLYFQF